MFLEKISLLNFKNYKSLELSFSPNLNLITGSNGSGKTNLLDAIYCLSLTKSAFMHTDLSLVNQGENFFSVMGEFISETQSSRVQIDLVQGKKSVKLDKKPYDKVSEHIGKFPVVLIAPNDTDLIRDGSEERRRFFDTILSQLDAVYLSELVRYNHILKQRNAMLKQHGEGRSLDRTVLESYDGGLLRSGKYIYEKRKAFIDGFFPVFLSHYLSLSEEKETPGLTYNSHWEQEDFPTAFHKNLEKDIYLQRTGLGTHKDDFVFTLDEQPIRQFGSQGQQKSYVISLKLAQYEVLKKEKGTKPLLLLDDIFDKLDDKRIKRLVQMVAEDAFGQIFITDASPERAKRTLQGIKEEIRIFRIEKGNLNQDSQDLRTMED